MNLKAVLTIAAGIALLPAAPAFAGKADDTLNVGFRLQLQSLDTYYSPGREGFLLGFWAYDALVYRDPATFEFVPALSTGWRRIDDLTLEFDIREGVKFHDGSVMTAEDVAYTLNFVAKPENNIFQQNIVTWIDRVEVSGPGKVRVFAKKVTPLAMQFISTLSIYPKAYYEKVGKEGMATKPVGTGPFVARPSGNDVVFERFPDYYADSPKGQPGISKVVYKTIPDVSTQVAELLTGGLDWAYYIPNDQAGLLGSNPMLDVVSEDSFRVAYLTLDAAGKTDPKIPTTDVRVRRAISHAIDREAIATNLVGGSASVVHAPCYPSQLGCDAEVVRYDHDVAKAKALMAEAGYADGFSIDILGYRNRQVAEAIINDLRTIGIRANLRWLQYPAVVERRRANQAPMIVDDWGSSSINDVAAILPVFFNTGADDYAMDKAVAEAIAKGGSVNDVGERKAAYAEALQRITDQAYFVPLHTMPINYVFTKDLDMPVPADEIPEFYRARWK